LNFKGAVRPLISSEPISVVILGGGFGGLYTALALARSPWVKAGHCQITLIDRNDHFLFTPLLYELISGELQRWEIAPSYQKLLQGTGIIFCQETVINIDLEDGLVQLNDGSQLAYRYLAIAVGCENRWVNIPGLRDHALTFRTLADVDRLQAQLHNLEASDRQRIRIAVIGGGANGVELACKLSDRLGKRGEIRLIERTDNLVNGFSDGVRRASYQALGKRNVLIELSTDVTRVETQRLTVCKQDQTQCDPIDLVLWTAGTQLRPWLSNLGIPPTPQGKLPVLPTLQLKNHPEVLILGDIAQIIPSARPIPATAQAAYQQAPTAARNLLALLQGKRLKKFTYFHLGDMLTLGRGNAIVSSFGLDLTGSLAGMMRRFAYIFRLPTLRHRVQVFQRLLKSAIQAIGQSFR
jgi:NADH dehydrogenase